MGATPVARRSRLWQFGYALLVALVPVAAHADPEAIRTYSSDLECSPSYMAIDPDHGAFTTLPVVIQRPSGEAVGIEFQFPIGSRCTEAKMVLQNILTRVELGPGWVVAVGACH